MNCAFDKEKLSGYYDGELETAEKAEVERHIASCSECLRELGELKSAALLVKELPRMRAPRSVAEGVSREIAASGKVHVLAAFRRNLMWAAAAAAGLFVVANLMYFVRREAPPAASGAQAPMPLGSPLAKVSPLREDSVEKGGAAPRGADQIQEKESRARQEELRKNLDAVDKRDAAKSDDARRGLGEAPGNRERAARELAKNAEQKPSEAPSPAAPVPQPTLAPPKPAAPPAAAAKEEGKGLTDGSTDKKKPGAEGIPQQDAEGLRAKQVAAVEAKAKEPVAGDVAPTQFTLATTQIAKARVQVEDTLKKLGCALPPPSMPMKGMKVTARESESTLTLELSESQIARLRQELEKQGESKLVAGSPEDPLVLSFLRGGSLVFGGGKKDVASGSAAPSARKKPEPKDRDGKESEDPKSAAEPAADKMTEPRRRVVLHLLEVKSLPAEPPVDSPVKK
jgi:hypothetical protein